MRDQVTSTVGLSAAEARSRLAEVGPNAVVTHRRVRLIRRLGNQLRDPLPDPVDGGGHPHGERRRPH